LGELDTNDLLLMDQKLEYYDHHQKIPLAVKMLRHTLVQAPLKFANAAVDLALEAAFLSSLDHPNIVKLHGISAGGPEGYQGGRHDSFFLILDCLTEILQDRIIRWRKHDKKLRHRLWIRRTEDRESEKISFMIERLKVAAEIALGVAYLHSRRLVHRDLKPCNIGFDYHGQVKIFDFSLCSVFPSEGICDVQHNMIGAVGTYG
jgi:serine/threonine protein kinase